jgi:predicted methyltransferase
LQAAIAADTRPAADRARDAYRHPYEALTFWGLTPGMTVVEIEPGGASWWRHILEPYAAATGGRYVRRQSPAGRAWASSRARPTSSWWPAPSTTGRATAGPSPI